MLLQDAEGQEGFGCILPEMQIIVRCRRATPKMLDSADAVVWHKRESLTQDLMLIDAMSAWSLSCLRISHHIAVERRLVL